MSIKYANTFHCKALQKLPKFGFLFENIPSGNPGVTHANALARPEVRLKKTGNVVFCAVAQRERTILKML
jgi:hypothetical protein